MWMLAREAWGAYADKGVVERLDLTAEVARSSGVRTAGRVVPEPVDVADSVGSVRVGTDSPGRT